MATQQVTVTSRLVEHCNIVSVGCYSKLTPTGLTTNTPYVQHFTKIPNHLGKREQARKVNYILMGHTCFVLLYVLVLYSMIL